jgi:ComF family protein
MDHFVQNIIKGLSQVAFPDVCVCCGLENTQEHRQICSFCLQGRFQDANPDNLRSSSDTLLPEGVLSQHALWQFSKGGDLQNLLHRLKYERLATIGVDLGRKLGERVQSHPFLLRRFRSASDATILPVPLHYLKFRYRGFNQAFEIARGFQEVWPELPICDIKSVARIKNTRTQTGFSLKKRLQNMNKAFQVKQPTAVEDQLVIIIDDVFTTGATTFELAQTVLEAGARSVIVLTVAQA